MKVPRKGSFRWHVYQFVSKHGTVTVPQVDAGVRKHLSAVQVARAREKYKRLHRSVKFDYITADILTQLKREGYIERVGRGLYRAREQPTKLKLYSESA